MTLLDTQPGPASLHWDRSQESKHDGHVLQTAAEAQGAQDIETTVLRLDNWRKFAILFIVSWNALVVTSTSTSVFVASPEIAVDLATTPEIINITNAGVLIAMGFSSLLWSPLAKLTSLRRSYNAALMYDFWHCRSTVC